MAETVPPATLAPATAALCAACGAPLAGRFCSACGERRPSPDDERLGPFLREQWQEVTSADGRLWATIKAIFVPGKLTTEFFAGRRGRYVRPVRIFLVANVLFFLALNVFGATSAFLGQANVQRSADYYGAWATEQLVEAAERTGLSQEAYDAAFDRQSGTLATSLVGLMVPMLALVLAVALFWRRVSGVRHLVFATHYLAFAMLGTLVVAVVWIPFVAILQVTGWIEPASWMAYTMDPLVLTVLGVYLLLGLRHVYALRWWQSAATTGIVVAAGIPAVTMAYRFVLFVVALWTTDVPAV